MSELELGAGNQLDDVERNRIVVENLGLVRFVANQFVGRGLPVEDLEQAGAIGAMRAVEKFDPTRGVAFSTYAVYWIRQAIQRELETTARHIRIPHYMEARIGQRLRGRIDEPETENERSAMVARDARCTGGEAPPVDAVHEAPSPQASAAQAERAALLREAVARLPLRTRYVVERAYGLHGGPPETQRQIAERVPVSRTRVGQLLKAARRRLARDLDFLE